VLQTTAYKPDLSLVAALCISLVLVLAGGRLIQKTEYQKDCCFLVFNAGAV
jgi:hypothetical protein